jgi:DNA-binding PadR family transcriptional regulator
MVAAMAKTRKVGNLLGLAVLAYLTREPMHPYELGRTLRHNDDGRSIKFSHGSLYMVVQQLAKAGFIAPRETSRQGQRPERTVYALTEAGSRELHDWMRELVEDPKHEYPQFVAALSLIGAMHPDDVVDLLHERLRRLAEDRAEIRALIDDTVTAGSHPLFLVEEEYRLALLWGESLFVKRFIDQITDPEHGWGALWAEFHDAPDAPGERHST